MTNHKDIFSALKKCNQIGKKLATNSKYILTNGMMIGYCKPAQEEHEAVGLGIAFIDNKILSKMDALPFMNIIIDGDELYQISQESEFLQFTVDNRNVYIEFKALETEEISDAFLEFASEKGFKEEDIQTGLLTNFEKSDIDLYELYLNYKKNNKPKTKTVIKRVECERIYRQDDCKILRKTIKVFKQLEKCNFLGYKELQPEIYEKLYNANQPIEFKINIDEEVHIIRLMKSVLSGATAKTNCEIRLLGNDNKTYIIIELQMSGFIICNIFRIIDF